MSNTNKKPIPLVGYFDHDADMGVIGRGKTLTIAFEKAAYAMFSLMANLDQVASTQSIEIDFEEDDNEVALVHWLNALLTSAQIKQLIFHRFQLNHRDNRWYGIAWGDHWQPTTTRGVEVKGATLTALSVKKVGAVWEARCVVDL